MARQRVHAYWFQPKGLDIYNEAWESLQCEFNRCNFQKPLETELFFFLHAGLEFYIDLAFIPHLVVHNEQYKKVQTFQT